MRSSNLTPAGQVAPCAVTYSNHYPYVVNATVVMTAPLTLTHLESLGRMTRPLRRPNRIRPIDADVPHITENAARSISSSSDSRHAT
jgi:hypothetical protein